MMENTGVYTTKQIAEKLNKAVAEICEMLRIGRC